MSAYQSERAISSFLIATGLHENEPIFVTTRQYCNRWRATLIEGTQHLPANRNKRVPGPGTIDKRMRMVSHWMSWLVAREYLETNPMEGMELPRRLVAASKTKKTSFSEVELSQIIPALLAMPEHDLPRTEFKWVTLALMFSGARCMEILQLKQKDIRQVDGYWVFDIQLTDTDNRVKNHPSVRLLPVHSQLVELGFLKWVAARRTSDHGCIFPFVHPKGSPLVSMWFSRILTALQMKRPEVSLHSLRHTLTVKLAEVRTHPPLQNRILGHALGQSVEDRIYLAGLTFNVKEMAEALEKVRFPVRLR